jgi:gliding motility-associated protein GldL
MGNFTDSIGWKSFIIKFGGIAAAVVIVGALFKIQHWPGAGIMITIGMSSEVVIFLLSALDTFHPDVDWSVVYPELKHNGAEHTGMLQQTEVVLGNGKESLATVGSDDTNKNLSENIASQDEDDIEKEQDVLPVVAQQPAFVPPVGLDLSKLDIDTAAITEGMKKFGESVGSLGALASAVSGAKDLSDKLQDAALAVGEFTGTYGNSTRELSESAEGLKTAYKDASSNIIKVGKEAGDVVLTSGQQMVQVTDEVTKILAESYKTITDNINDVGREACEMVSVSGQQMSQMVETSTKILAENYQVVENNINNMGKEVCESVVTSGKQLSEVILSATDSFAETFTLLDREIKQNLTDFSNNNNDYNKSLESLNKNMSALNATYELQVQEVIKYQKKSSEIGQYMETFVEGLDKSASENQLFYKALSNLNRNIAELNNVYGGMLSAVQMVTKRK